MFSAGGAGDTLVLSGDFSGTDLLTTTISFDGGAGADTVDASGLTSAHRVVATGEGGTDSLAGGAGDDLLFGGADDDDLAGNGGNDLIDGGGGLADTAFFAGSVADYSVTLLPGGSLQVVDNVGSDGTDIVTDVENLDFNGVVIPILGPVLVFDAVGTLVGSFATIQDAVNAAADGFTVLAGPGTYNENVVINDSITLLSSGGRAVTTIEGGQAGGELGAIEIDPNTDGVTIGGVGQGFTIIGINGNGAVEKAAIYIQGSNDGIDIQDNEVVANGDAGLLSEFAAALTNVLIDGNEFSGQTFDGANPGGIGFSTQFNVGNNVPHQLVTLGNGNNPAPSSNNITFTNNELTGTAGGISSDDLVSEQGNTLVTIDAADSTISNNLITGFTARFGVGIRARGPNTDVEDNTFDHTTGGNSHGTFINSQGVPANYEGNVLIGGEDTDVFFATPGNDDLSGNDGKDFLTGSIGDDLIDGGADIDTAGYFGTAADYTVTTDGSGNPTQVVDNNVLDLIDEGTDTLTSIENVFFFGEDPVQVFDASGQFVSAHTTIQDAIDAVTTLDGFKIVIGAGVYNEAVTVDKELTLAGVGNVELNGTGLGGASGITIAADNVTIDPLTVTGFGTHGIFVGTTIANLVLDGVVTTGNTFDGIRLDAVINASRCWTSRPTATATMVWRFTTVPTSRTWCWMA